MNNIHLIYGEEEYLIKKNIKDLIEKLNIDNIIYYNLDEDNLTDVLLEVQTVSLFDTKKIIVCENSNFLSSSSKANDNETKSLLKYLETPFEDVYLIIILNESKLDERKKIVKELKKVAKVIECKKIENYDLNNYILNYITDKGYKISNRLVTLLISIVGINLMNLINEIDKILIYKDKDLEITEEDIKGLATTNIENNIFTLTNSFLSSDKEKTLKIYNDLLSLGVKHEAILGTISNQLRLILDVALMKKNGYSDTEMVNILKEHPYRIKLAKENIYDINKLKNKVLELSYLDLDIKSNKIDKTLGLELFLLNI